jgi:TonB family protein
MPHPRIAKSNVLFVFLAIVASQILGIDTLSPNASAQQGHLIPPQLQESPMGMGIKILSPTAGADFSHYVETLLVSIRLKFLAELPKSGKGVVVVRFQIQKDGSLADNSATITSSSGSNEMDAAALSAIRTAAPFGRLPEGYAGGYLELKLGFYFNNKPQEPAPQPKLVPIG